MKEVKEHALFLAFRNAQQSSCMLLYHVQLRNLQSLFHGPAISPLLSCLLSISLHIPWSL